MKLTICGLIFTLALSAADPAQQELVARAQADFDRIAQGSVPGLQDALACVQSQAALIPVAPPAQLPLLHYRKGVCALAGASVSSNPAAFTEAAVEFQKAIDTWPAGLAGRKHEAPPAVTPALPAAEAIAWLKSGNPESVAAAEALLVSTFRQPVCPDFVVPEATCQAYLRIGREWLGWIALRAGRLDEADAQFAAAAAPDAQWRADVGGLVAFNHGHYADAEVRYRHAVEASERRRQQAAANWFDRLRPELDTPRALEDLGGAQLASGDAAGAIVTLDAAAKAAPGRARVLYLRARARELVGDSEGALADYNLASRAAFAAAQDLASGEAHLYRGILLYRRRDYPRAEAEFASALNFEIEPAMRADDEAWRHLAAVAAGSCEASRDYLSRALQSVSPYFPKREALAVSAACRASTSSAERRP